MLDETPVRKDRAEDIVPADSTPTAYRKTPQRGPRRVLPLAVVAVAATVLMADMASAAIWDLSGHRYAAQVIADVF